MVRLNDPKTVDQLLSIPAQNFTIEDVNLVAVACKAARKMTFISTIVTLSIFV